MKDIAIFGMGGFGREVACLINSINKGTPQWNVIGFFDDGKELGEKCEYGECLGGLEILNSWPNPLSVVISIAKPSTIKYLVESIKNKNIDFPNIISNDVCWFDRQSVQLGKGNIIAMDCQLSCNIKIGDFNIFNCRVNIGHDTQIGNFNSVMTDAKIAGSCVVGDYNYIGVNAVILQGLNVGNNTTVAAGSVIMRRTKDGYTYIGVPANAWKMTKKNNI